MKLASWKTTAFGMLGAIGTYLSTIHDPAWMATIGTILVGLSSAGIGLFARDANVTSEQEGAGK